MSDVLVDTDVFIDHLRGFRELQTGRDRIHYSVITRCELLAGTDGEDAVRRLIEPFQELSVDRVVADRGGRIRRETGLEVPDALIAATAISYELTLITRNRKHFGRVHQLRSRPPGTVD